MYLGYMDRWERLMGKSVKEFLSDCLEQFCWKMGIYKVSYPFTNVIPTYTMRDF